MFGSQAAAVALALGAGARAKCAGPGHLLTHCAWTRRAAAVGRVRASPQCSAVPAVPPPSVEDSQPLRGVASAAARRLTLTVT